MPLAQLTTGGFIFLHYHSSQLFFQGTESAPMMIEFMFQTRHDHPWDKKFVNGGSINEMARRPDFLPQWEIYAMVRLVW